MLKKQIDKLREQIQEPTLLAEYDELMDRVCDSIMHGAKAKAIMKQFQVDIYDVTVCSPVCFAVNEAVGKNEYAVYTHEERHAEARDAVKFSMYDSYVYSCEELAEVTGKGIDLFRCEKKNPFVIDEKNDGKHFFDYDWLQNVIDNTCGEDAFIEYLVKVQGYATLLSPIEVEYEVDGLYIYALC